LEEYNNAKEEEGRGIRYRRSKKEDKDVERGSTKKA